MYGYAATDAGLPRTFVQRSWAPSERRCLIHHNASAQQLELGASRQQRRQHIVSARCVCPFCPPYPSTTLHARVYIRGRACVLCCMRSSVCSVVRVHVINPSAC